MEYGLIQLFQFWPLSTENWGFKSVLGTASVSSTPWPSDGPALRTVMAYWKS